MDTNMQKNYLIFDTNTMQQIKKNLHYPINNIHPSLKQPTINTESVIQGIINQHNAAYPVELHNKINQSKQNIDTINAEISKLDAQAQDININHEQYLNDIDKVKPEITQKLETLKSFFPNKQFDSILSNFFNYDRMLRNMQNNMGTFTKLFQSKSRTQEFEKLYSEITALAKELGIYDLAAPETNIQSNIRQNKTQTNTKLNIINEKKQRLQNELNIEQKQLAEYTKQHDILSDKLHQDIAEFLNAYENRHLLRKNIPATLNMQGLNEPVAFFQSISNITPEELTTLLSHAGLRVGYNPSEYIIRQSRTISGDPCLELITPFYSPEKARRNITEIMKYLAEHGATFNGIIKPATYSQINPLPTHNIQQTDENRARIIQYIQEKLQSPDALDRDTFYMQYHTNDEQKQYLFRGHTFITSDPKSSYATPTWRPGRTGIVYGSTDPKYAASYAGGADYDGVNGKTMNSQHLLHVNNYNVGFVTVFKNSKRNIFVSDINLETMGKNKHLKPSIKINQMMNHVNETIISPHNNPVVARYMVVGNKMVKIDDNDEKWREIMDFMAPDLNMTHITSFNKEQAGPTQTTHGQALIQRIQNIQNEIENTGSITTYDIPDENLQKLGYKSPTEQFINGTNKINQMSDILLHRNMQQYNVNE